LSNCQKSCRFEGAFACVIIGKTLTFLLANALNRFYRCSGDAGRKSFFLKEYSYAKQKENVANTAVGRVRGLRDVAIVLP